MIKVIIFDLWNTIAYHDLKPSFESKVKKVLKIAHGDVNRGVEESIQLRNWPSLKAQMTAIAHHFRRYPNPKILTLLEDYRKKNISTAKAMPGIHPVLAALKNKYVLALLSNTDNLVSARWEQLGLAKYFDHVFLSYQTKQLKPDKGAYLYALKKLGAKPEEVLFIDDSLANVIAAENLGMNAIHFKNTKDLRHQLKKIKIF